MAISPINFTGTIYAPSKKIGINTDNVVTFYSAGKNTEVYFTDGNKMTLPVDCEQFKDVYIKASSKKNAYAVLDLLPPKRISI